RPGQARAQVHLRHGLAGHAGRGPQRAGHRFARLGRGDDRGRLGRQRTAGVARAGRSEGGSVMPIYALGDLTPAIDPTAYVSPEAVVIGNVVLGPESSIWPGAVLRGDHGLIQVGARTSIQDGSIVHTTEHWPTIVGPDCVVGHLVHLEG